MSCESVKYIKLNLTRVDRCTESRTERTDETQKNADEVTPTDIHTIYQQTELGFYFSAVN